MNLRRLRWTKQCDAHKMPWMGTLIPGQNASLIEAETGHPNRTIVRVKVEGSLPLVPENKYLPQVHQGRPMQPRL